jgi:hypothetical protein
MIITFERPDRFWPSKDNFFHSVGNRMLNTIFERPKTVWKFKSYEYPSNFRVTSSTNCFSSAIKVAAKLDKALNAG